MCDNKVFWKNVKHLFSGDKVANDNLTLADKENVKHLFSDDKVANDNLTLADKENVKHLFSDNKVANDNITLADKENVNHLFSDNKVANDNITLADKGHIISEDGKIAECFNDFSVNTVKEICMDFDNRYMKPDHIEDPVINIIEIIKITLLF